MGGLDLWCAVEDNLFKELNKSDKACDLLRRKVADGKLGLKSGQGFFTYTSESKTQKLNDFSKRLIIQLKASKHY
jgi:3-hydroxybutyryl-CoA dehydrogenase